MLTPDQRHLTVQMGDAEALPILADALGDTPETVISHYLLTAGACRAWYVGDIRQPRAVAVQADAFPAEPTVFGESASAIVRLLSHFQGWTSVLVPAVHARELERPVAVAAGTLEISTLEDVYHVLDGPLAEVSIHPDVRLLTADDVGLLEGMPQLASHAGEAIVAAAIVEGEIVSLAHTFAWSPRYVDLGVTTHEDWRGQGLATSAAALVAAEVVLRGRVPVWSCGASNAPSLRIARRLGFRETGRRLYLIPSRNGQEP